MNFKYSKLMSLALPMVLNNCYMVRKTYSTGGPLFFLEKRHATVLSYSTNLDQKMHTPSWKYNAKNSQFLTRNSLDLAIN